MVSCVVGYVGQELVSERTSPSQWDSCEQPRDRISLKQVNGLTASKPADAQLLWKGVEGQKKLNSPCCLLIMLKLMQMFVAMIRITVVGYIVDFPVYVFLLRVGVYFWDAKNVQGRQKPTLN